MKMNICRILVAMTFIAGVTTISFSQENEAPAKINRDTVPKPRYTLQYPELTHPVPNPGVPEATPIIVDSVKSTEINSVGITPDSKESSLSDSVSTKSLGAKGVLQTPETESGLHISESGLPVTESGLPASSQTITPATNPTDTETKSPTTHFSESGLPVTESGLPASSQTITPATNQTETETKNPTTHFSESGLPVTESGLPASSQTITPATNPTETETKNPTTHFSESGLPMNQDQPVNDYKSTASNPIITESSSTPESEAWAEHPVSTSRYVDPESKNNKAKTSPEGTRHDWSNPPGFVGTAQNKNVKMEKHVMKTKKHKYRPHHKYQHKTHYRSPKF
jgi:hypothetical protein